MLVVPSGLACAGDPPNGKALAEEIDRLGRIKEKSFDDLVRLALLNRKLHDWRAYRKWLASAASAHPSAAFTSERSPFVYVRVWSMLAPEHFVYLSVREADAGSFYAALATAGGTPMPGGMTRVKMAGVDRIDPLTRDVRRITINEDKADFASSMDADREGNFYLGHFGVVFVFRPDGGYDGQIVTMHRHKIREANTLYRALNGDEAYVTDAYRFISRINRRADTLSYITLECGRDATITGIAADKDENLFLGLIGDNCIVMLRPDLTERCRIGGTGLGSAEALALTALDAGNQTIVFSDPPARRLQVLDKNGAYLMGIPAEAFSVAVNGRGTMLTLEGNRVVCYARFFKDTLPETNADFAAYVEGIKLMEEGKLKAGREILRRLNNSDDANLAEVSKSLTANDTLALARHYEKPRWLTIPEVERLTGRKAKQRFLDPYENSTWVSPADGFLLRVDEFERVTVFDIFPRLHGLAGKLTVNGMRLYEYWCYAATDRGICRYSRKHGDWQFVPGAKTLDDVTPDGR